MDDKIVILGPSGAGKYSMSKVLQVAMSGGKQFGIGKCYPPNEQEQLSSMLFEREMSLEQIKAKDILDNIALVKDQDLLKEVSRRGLNLGFNCDSLESVSTTQLKSELRRRKK